MIRFSLPRMFAGCLTALVALSVLSTAAKAEDTLVAVAANFAEAAEELAPLFEKTTGHRLVTTTGSTGKLYAQIKNGAPFQVLLSADAKTPAKLAAEKAAVAGTSFTYATGKLALWSSEPGRVGVDGAKALEAGDFRHIAIANPALAPYGVAARETLQSLGLWEKLAARIVMGENIGQIHAMVSTGNAELGFVALSAIENPHADGKGSYWVVPQAFFTPIRQDAILLNPGADNAAAKAFLAFLKSAEARAVIKRYGYGID